MKTLKPLLLLCVYAGKGGVGVEECDLALTGSQKNWFFSFYLYVGSGDGT